MHRWGKKIGEEKEEEERMSRSTNCQLFLLVARECIPVKHTARVCIMCSNKFEYEWEYDEKEQGRSERQREKAGRGGQGRKGREMIKRNGERAKDSRGGKKNTGGSSGCFSLDPESHYRCRGEN